jgi:hypothetical protein
MLGVPANGPKRNPFAAPSSHDGGPAPNRPEARDIQATSQAPSAQA